MVAYFTLWKIHKMDFTSIFFLSILTVAFHLENKTIQAYNFQTQELKFIYIDNTLYTCKIYENVKNNNCCLWMLWCQKTPCYFQQKLENILTHTCESSRSESITNLRLIKILKTWNDLKIGGEIKTRQG
jgi:hypothetical protein